MGTFLLVFFGCGAVAISVTTDSLEGVFPVAAVWGVGLTVAIFLVSAKSGAHLNPAITFPMALFRDFPMRRVPGYIGAQFLGAILASVALLSLYASLIRQFEVTAADTVLSASILGCYFDESRLSHREAFLAELGGTTLLAFVVFSLTHSKAENRLPPFVIPPAIGGTLVILICLMGPLTAACFNPARDLGPKVVAASLGGWGLFPFEHNGLAWLTVYTAAPIFGGVLGGWLAERFARVGTGGE